MEKHWSAKKLGVPALERIHYEVYTERLEKKHVFPVGTKIKLSTTFNFAEPINSNTMNGWNQKASDPSGVWFADTMSSFSGVTLVCLFHFRLFAFTEAEALRSIVFRSSICMRPDNRTQLPNNCLRYFSSSFSSVFCFFGDVAFSVFFCTTTVFSFYGEYVVRFPLPNSIFLSYDLRLDSLHHLM